MILAYHFVVGGTKTLDRVLRKGTIAPAAKRIDCGSMKEECFGSEVGIKARWPSADPTAIQALQAMAKDVLEVCRRDHIGGSALSAFTCLDMIAGDLEYVFLSLNEWYEFHDKGPNGLVFDAEKLIRAGALFRPADLLGRYQGDMDVAMGLKYEDLAHARGVLEGLIRDTLKHHQLKGDEALQELRYGDWERGSGAELVWRGELSTRLAREIWREGRRLVKP